MAHVGKYYRINQALRWHAFNEQWPFFPPYAAIATVQTFAHSVGFTPPATPYVRDIALWAGGIGFDWYEYRSAIDTIAGRDIQIGFTRQLMANHWQATYRFQVWVDNVKQVQETPHGNYVPVWVFEASPAHLPVVGAELWPSPIGGLVEAVLWP